MFKFREPNHPLARLLYPIAAVGPAALFAFMWRGLNAEFLPFIGKGANSTQTSVVAGAVFWFWIYRKCRATLKDSPEPATVGLCAKWIYWQLVAAAIAIPAGRIIFSFVPPWDNSIGAVLGFCIGAMFVGWHFRSQGNRFVHARGTVLIDEQEARERIKNFPQWGEPRIKWAGYDLPGEIAEGNLLNVGAVGTGKTRMHRELMASIMPSIQPGGDRRMLIYDVKCDLLSELSAMNPASKVIVFNAFDERSVAWDVAADVTDPDQCGYFAEALIVPDKDGHNAFFTEGARNIVAGVIESLNRTHPGNWDLRRLILLTATFSRLERVLAGSDLIDQYFSPRETFDNIRNTIANAMVKLKPVASLWKHAKTKISLKEWVKNGDSILVLGGREDLQASLQPINRIAVKIISTTFLAGAESAQHARLWFFCDELKTAGRLDALPALLNGRSKGVRCVLGFQDLEGLFVAYGNRDAAKEILARCLTISWLKLGGDDTARWASERSGQEERFEYFTTKTKDGTSTGEQLAKREGILASEFLHLPDFSDGVAEGFHLIRGVGAVFRGRARYTFLKSEVPDFISRPSSEQILDPWDASDDEWLDGGKSGPAPSPKPDTPDAGAVGRIDFERNPKKKR